MFRLNAIANDKAVKGKFRASAGTLAISNHDAIKKGGAFLRSTGNGNNRDKKHEHKQNTALRSRSRNGIHSQK